MSIFNFKSSNYTFLLGNGINLLESGMCKSWFEIIDEIEPKFSNKYVEGYPLTEYFDLLKTVSNLSTKEYRARFITNIETMTGNKIHQEIFNFCSANNINILTMNFDHGFEIRNELKKKHISLAQGFSDVYPWQVYYAKEDLGIRVYHINGDISYKRSIKLSVKDYARNINHYDKKYNPLHNKNQYTDEVWLYYLFEKDVVIAGLSLGEEEIFLRQILIDRYRYQKHKDLETASSKSYYLYREKDFKASDIRFKRLKLFLDSVGIIMKSYESYEAIYRK